MMTHIGDGVYVNYDGYHLVLSAVGDAGTIYLTPKVWKNLIEYIKTLDGYDEFVLMEQPK